MTIDERLEFLVQSTESLHAHAQEQSALLDKQMAIIDKHTEQLKIDAENIRRLANIASAHERRLDDIEGANPS